MIEEARAKYPSHPAVEKLEEFLVIALERD